MSDRIRPSGIRRLSTVNGPSMRLSMNFARALTAQTAMPSSRPVFPTPDSPGMRISHLVISCPRNYACVDAVIGADAAMSFPDGLAPKQEQKGATRCTLLGRLAGCAGRADELPHLASECGPGRAAGKGAALRFASHVTGYAGPCPPPACSGPRKSAPGGGGRTRGLPDLASTSQTLERDADHGPHEHQDTGAAHRRA